MSTAISERVRVACARCLLALCLWMMPSLVLTARADSATDRGAELFSEGVAKVASGDYPGALAAFREAHALTGDWRLLFNIAQVLQRLEDYARALEHLERYLAEGGEQVAVARRESVETEILRLHERVSTLSIQVNEPGALVELDDRELGQSPLSARVLVNAGSHRVRVHKAGFQPAERTIVPALGRTESVTIELVAEPSLVLDGGTARRRAPWLAWTATSGLLVSSAVTGAFALVAKEDAERKSDDLTTRRSLDDAKRKALTFGLTSDVLAASALGVGIYAIVRTLKPAPRDGERRISAEVGPRGVRLRWRF